ncbi:MAG: CBS domain-containing protein [Gemmatimonadota bacterium]
MDTEMALALEFATTHPDHAARLMERQHVEEVAAFLQAGPASVGAEVLSRMETFLAAGCLAEMDRGRAGRVLAALRPQHAAVLLRKLDREVQEALLAGLEAQERLELETLLHFADGTAGALMNPRVLSIPADHDVAQARQAVLGRPEHALHHLYVVDRQQVLAGVVTLRELMISPPEMRLEELMQKEVVSLQAGMALPTVLAHPGWLEHQTLPVVDEAGRLLGALRHKDLHRLVSGVGAAGRGAGRAGTGSALGELYGLALAGVVQGAASLLSGPGDDTPDQVR